MTQPVPTYRHLLSPTAQTPWNPLRVIAHCDIDAAYAQFEAVRLGVPDDVPLIVIQWETIIAVNYPARPYGIKRCSHHGPKEARELCPHVQIVHTATYRPGDDEAGYWENPDVMTHKVSLDPYRKESQKILAIFKELVPKSEVEKASIDEAYMDLTAMSLTRLLSLHPHLSTPPSDAPDGLDTPLPPAPPIDWSKAGNLVPTDKELAIRRREQGEYEGGDGEENSDEEDVHASADRSERRGETDGDTWQDWALCMGAEIMAEVRRAVWDRLHYTCSAGIAHNKAMAKLCSSYRKPNGQTVLRHAAVPSFLRDRNFTDIRNLGGKLGRCIAEEFKAETVGELMRVSLEEMQDRFGEESIWVYNLIRGIDHIDLTARHVNKTMLASKNILPAITHPEGAIPWIDLLAGELHVRLREAREVEPGLWPKTLVMSYRSGYSYANTRTRQLPFPFTRDLNAGYVAKYGRRMWRGVMSSVFYTKGVQVTNLSLQFSGVERMEEGQVNIDGFFARKSKAIEDNDHLVPGSSAASVDRPSLKRSRSSSSSLAGPGESIETKEPLARGSAWQCDKCLRIFDVPYDNTTADFDIEELERQARAEHADYHFALELSRTVEPDYNGSRSESGSGSGSGSGSPMVKVEDVKPGIKMSGSDERTGTLRGGKGGRGQANNKDKGKGKGQGTGKGRGGSKESIMAFLSPKVGSPSQMRKR